MPDIPAGTKVLLHNDGADLSTTFTDSSAVPHTFTANGDAIISTTQKKFGTASAKFQGAGYISTPDSADFDVGTGDWNIGFWIYPTSLSGFQCILSVGDQSGFDFSFELFLNDADLNLAISEDGVGGNASFPFDLPLPSLTINTWQHVSLERYLGEYYIYISGVESTTPNGSYAGGGIFNSTADLIIGKNPWGPNYLSAYIDEFIFIKGSAEHTGNFTPNAEAYGEEDTEDPVFGQVLLLEFEGADGSQDFIDSSPIDHTITVEDTPYGDVEIDTSEFEEGVSSGYFQNWMGNDSYTRLLLHGNVSPIVDSSENSETLTPSGGITIDTNNAKFGAGSISFDGTNDSLVCTDFQPGFFGGNDPKFTIDMWISPLASSAHVMGYMDASGTDISWYITLESGVLKFFFTSDGETIIDSGVNIDISGISGFTHIAFEANGDDLFGYKNGNVVDSEIGVFTTNFMTTNHQNLRIGIVPTGAAYHGLIDELRISSRQRWYGEDFTPMPREYGPALGSGVVANGGALNSGIEAYNIEGEDFDIEFDVKFRYGLAANVIDKPCIILSKRGDTEESFVVDFTEIPGA